MAARLQHPHIMPLHDSGEADGFVYYVMPYVQGESLRDRLMREGQLPLDEALHIARDVANALDYAHGNDIVHRDIKPENIFLSGGHAIVMDFGIARALSVSAGDEAITSPGMAVGTPAYMSPEQATAGRVIDGRADIYALACVVYEMLAGHPPFLGTTAQEILARQSLDPVPSLRGSRPDLSGSVDRAVAKALSKAPADRYSTARRFVDACVRSDVDRVDARPRRLWPWAAILIVGIAALALASYRMLHTPTQTLAFPSAEIAPSIAVLAFKNIGGDSSSEALSDGISEEIAATIGRIPGLDVKAPRSSFSLKDKNLNIREMGKALGVRFLVDGSVQSDARRLRVRVALVSASNDSTLWRNEYDRPLGDVFVMQDDIARAIASELRVQLAPSAAEGISRVSTKSAEAHELYLRGRVLFERRHAMRQRQAHIQSQLGIWICHTSEQNATGKALRRPGSRIGQHTCRGAQLTGVHRNILRVGLAGRRSRVCKGRADRQELSVSTLVARVVSDGGRQRRCWDPRGRSCAFPRAIRGVDEYAAYLAAVLRAAIQRCPQTGAKDIRA
jgi:serine/threonine-protein kinase